MRDFAGGPGIAPATIYRRQRQAQIGAGEIVGVNSAMASELADAKRRIRDLEEELAVSRLKDDCFRGEGGYRSPDP